jgi:uncharacterized cupredoxin-like copper-binding protein
MFTLKMRMQRALMVYSLSLGLAVCASSWAAYEAFERNPEWAAGGHAHGAEDAHSTHDAPTNTPTQSALVVDRILQVDMNDTMRFTPDLLQVAAGETLKLVVHNSGKLPHEMVLGSEAALKAHSIEMKQSAGPSGGHDHGSGNDLLALSVKPGETKEWVIRFDQAQTLQMACLIPGHFEAGMKGQVIVQDKGSTAQSIQTTKPEKKSNNAHDHSSHQH